MLFVGVQVLLFYPDGKRSSSTENAVDVADGGGPAGIRIPVPGVQQRPPQAAGPPGGAGAHAAGPPANGGPDAGAARAAGRQAFDGPPGARPEPQQMQQLPVMRPGMAPPVPLPPVAGAHAHGAAGFPADADADAPVPAAGAAAPALPPPALRPQHQQGAGAHAGGPGGGGEAGGPEPGLPERRAQALNQAQRQAAAEAAVANANAAVHAAAHAQAAVHHAAAAAHGQAQHMPPGAQPVRRDPTNDYAALFVALIGEGENPQGVVNTSDGRVVRAFHRFTLVDQSGEALASSCRNASPVSRRSCPVAAASQGIHNGVQTHRCSVFTVVEATYASPLSWCPLRRQLYSCPSLQG